MNIPQKIDIDRLYVLLAEQAGQSVKVLLDEHAAKARFLMGETSEVDIKPIAHQRTQAAAIGHAGSKLEQQYIILEQKAEGVLQKIVEALQDQNLHGDVPIARVLDVLRGQNDNSDNAHEAITTVTFEMARALLDIRSEDITDGPGEPLWSALQSAAYGEGETPSPASGAEGQ